MFTNWHRHLRHQNGLRTARTPEVRSAKPPTGGAGASSFCRPGRVNAQKVPLASGLSIGLADRTSNFAFFVAPLPSFICFFFDFFLLPAPPFSFLWD